MAIALKLSFLLTLVIPLLAGPHERVESKEKERNHLLSSLSDLSLSNEEAFKQIETKVHLAMGLPKETPENFWFDLLSKKIDFGEHVNPLMNSNSITAELFELVDQEFAKLTDIMSIEIQDNDEEEYMKSVQKTEQKTAQTLTSVVNQIALVMRESLKEELKVQFNHVLTTRNIHDDNEVETVELNLLDNVEVEVHNAVTKKLNLIMETTGMDLTSYAQGILSSLEKQIVDFKTHEYSALASIFILFRRTKLLLVIEAEYLFDKSQFEAGFSEDKIVSRLRFIFEKIAELSHTDDKHSDLLTLFDYLYKQKQDFYNGVQQMTSDFIPIHNGAISALLNVINNKISPEQSFTQAQRFFFWYGDLNTDFARLFFVNQIKQFDSLMFLNNKVSGNSYELLSIINVITSLKWEDIDSIWWTYVLNNFEKLLAVDRHVAILSSNSLFQLGNDQVLNPKKVEFLQTLYSLLMNFAQEKGTTCTLEDWNVVFDSYINEAFTAENAHVKKFYVLLKMNNHFQRTSKTEYKLNFLNFAPDQESADRTRQVFTDSDYDNIRIIAWNALDKYSDKKKTKSNLDKNVFLLEMSEKEIPSTYFLQCKFKESQTSKVFNTPQVLPALRIRHKNSEIDHNEVSKIQISLQNASSLKNSNKISQKLQEVGIEEIHDDNNNHENHMTTIEEESPIIVQDESEHHSSSKHKVDHFMKSESKIDEEQISQNVENPIVLDLDNLSMIKESDIRLREEMNLEGLVFPVLERHNAVIFDKNGSFQGHRSVGTSTDDLESVEGTTILHELVGKITSEERRVLQSDNLDEVLREYGIQTDIFGNQVSFAYVKIIPRDSECATKILSE